MSSATLTDLFENDLRLGELIYIPGACSVDSVAENLMELIDDEPEFFQLTFVMCINLHYNNLDLNLLKKSLLKSFRLPASLLLTRMGTK